MTNEKQDMSNNEREILKSCYKVKRAFKRYNKIRKWDSRIFLAHQNDICYALSNLKESINYSQDTLRKVDNIGRYYVSLLKKSANLEKEAAFHPQCPERTKALGYLGGLEYADTMNYLANKTYKALIKVGYDKGTIENRLDETIGASEKILSTMNSTMYTQEYRKNESLSLRFNFNNRLEATLYDSRRLKGETK